MSKPTDHWTESALNDLALIWERNPRCRDQLIAIRAKLEDRLESETEELAEDTYPDGTAIGFEPRFPWGEEMVIAIGIRFVVLERKVFHAWDYVKPDRRRRGE